MKFIFSLLMFIIIGDVFCAESATATSLANKLRRVQTVSEYIQLSPEQSPLQKPLLLPAGNWGISIDTKDAKFYEIELELKEAEEKFKHSLALYDSGSESLVSVCIAKENLIDVIQKKINFLAAVSTKEELNKLHAILQEELRYTYKQQLVLLNNDYKSGVIGKDAIDVCEQKLKALGLAN